MEPHNPVVKLVVAGVTGHEAAVVAALQNRLNIPCTLLNPAEAMELPRAARDHAAGSISALGLALGANDPEGLPFDFLNPKRPAVQRNLRRLRLMMSAAAAMAALLLVGGIQRHFINKRETEYQALKVELSQANTKRPIYRQMRLQATSAQNWVQQKRKWLDHYAYLSAILPPSEEVYLGSFSVSGQGTIRLAVQARSGEVLAKMEKLLRAAGYSIKPLAITPGADRYGCNFRSNVELGFSEDMKLDLAKVRAPARPADDVSLEEGIKSARKGGG
jgi:outer membrane murein-binding lipoprotein Lpp